MSSNQGPVVIGVDPLIRERQPLPSKNGATGELQ